MNLKRFVFVWFSAAVLSVLFPKVAAATTYWSSNAAGCVAAAGSGTYTVSAGTVTVGNGSTVTLYCPIHDGDTLAGQSFLAFELDYLGLHQSNIAGHSYTMVELVRISRSTGVESNPSPAPNPMVYTAPGSSSYSQSTSGSFTLDGPMDFDSYFYYVRVTISVNTSLSGHDQTFYGVAIIPGLR